MSISPKIDFRLIAFLDALYGERSARRFLMEQAIDSVDVAALDEFSPQWIGEIESQKRHTRRHSAGIDDDVIEALANRLSSCAWAGYDLLDQLPPAITELKQVEQLVALLQIGPKRRVPVPPSGPSVLGSPLALLIEGALGLAAVGFVIATLT